MLRIGNPLGLLLLRLRLRKSFHPAENLHELLARDRLLLNQEGRNLIHGIAVFTEKPLGLLVGLLEDPHNLHINLRRRGIPAVEHGPARQVLVLLGGQAHQAELLGHAVLGHHGPGQIGGLLDIIGRSGGHISKYNLLRSPAAHELHQTGLQLLLGVQVLLLLGHVHHVAQGAHGSRHNGNLLHRLGVLLERTDQGVSHLVVGDDAPLLLAHDPILLLLAHQHNLHSLKKVLLGHCAAAVLHRVDGGLIHHVGQIRAHGSGGGQGNLLKVHGLVKEHVLGVHL